MRRRKGITIPPLNEDLAYLCGVLVGDGSIAIREHKKEYLVNCGGNPKDEISFYQEVISPLFRKLFSLDVKARSLGKTYGVVIYSRNLVEFLVERIGLSKSPKNELNVPKDFYRDQNLLLSFISGIADTDFSFKLRKGAYPVISGCSKSRVLMEEISSILEKFEFKVCRTFDYKAVDPRLKNGYNIINRIDINGHWAFKRWIDLIGTRHPKNQQKITLWKERNKNNHRVSSMIQKVIIKSSGGRI